jgi:hypothetical protein
MNTDYCSIVTSSRLRASVLLMATMTMMAEPQAMVLTAPSKIEMLPIELKLDIASYVRRALSDS